MRDLKVAVTSMHVMHTADLVLMQQQIGTVFPISEGPGESPGGVERGYEPGGPAAIEGRQVSHQPPVLLAPFLPIRVRSQHQDVGPCSSSRGSPSQNCI